MSSCSSQGQRWEGSTATRRPSVTHLPGQPGYPEKSAPAGTTVPSSSPPWPESAMRNTEDSNTLGSLSRLISTRSNKLWRSSMTAIRPKSIPHQTWGRKGGCGHWVLIIMLWVLPKKSGTSSCIQLPNSKYMWVVGGRKKGSQHTRTRDPNKKSKVEEEPGGSDHKQPHPLGRHNHTQSS